MIQAILIRTVRVAVRPIQVPTKELGVQQVPAPGAWPSTVLRPTQAPGATQVGQWLVQRVEPLEIKQTYEQLKMPGLSAVSSPRV